MSTVIHFIGLDVHKESVAVSIAPSNSTEVRHYGTIGGALADMTNPHYQTLIHMDQSLVKDSSGAKRP